MQVNAGSQPHFGKTTIITGPSEEIVNRRLHEEESKAHGAVGVLASPFGDQYRGRLLTGHDIYKFFRLVDIPFKGRKDKAANETALDESFHKFRSPEMGSNAVIGYALTQEAVDKAQYINITA
ncbi:MAG TPA: hypothetical protein V6C52_04105 [Coleofasciculaceae cyanobacterium]|jgi:hypothetical protein